MYQKPPGCTFNGRVWVRDNPPISSPTPEAAASSISSGKRTRVLYTTPSDRQERPSNEDERDVKRPTSEDGQPRRVEYQNASSSRGWPPYARSAPRAGPDDPDAISYACFRRGHIAEHCTDRVAKAKNDTYLARRRPARGYEEQGNDRRPQQRESYGPDQRYPEPQSRRLDASTSRYGPRPNLSQPPPPQRRRGQSLDDRATRTHPNAVKSSQPWQREEVDRRTPVVTRLATSDETFDAAPRDEDEEVEAREKTEEADQED